MQAAVAFRRFPAAILLAAAASCTSVNPTAATFEGTRWQVTAINARATPGGEGYRMQFEDGRIGGRFGCNQFGGPYRVRGDVLIATDVASTLMGCPDPAASFEPQGFAILRQPMRMVWQSGQQLTLSNGAGSIALTRTD